MKFSIYNDPIDGIVFSGSISHSDFARIDFDRADQMLLDDVSKAKDVTAADYLLALQTVYFRHHQQARKKA